MYHRRTTSCILLLAIFFSHVVPAIWSQYISGKDHTVNNSSLYQLQHMFPALLYPHLQKSSLYEYQHVFSGLWQPQLHHKGVYLRHFGKETSQQISIHQREYSFQDQASLYGIGQCNLHETIMYSAGQLEFPTTAGPLAQQRRLLFPNTVFHNDIA